MLNSSMSGGSDWRLTDNVNREGKGQYISKGLEAFNGKGGESKPVGWKVTMAIKEEKYPTFSL